jgi:hypothetical protein
MQTAQIIPFQFDTHEVRTLLINDQPWFVAADVAAALLYSEASAMTRHLDDDEKGLSNVQTLGGYQELLVINESGLYSAILRSRKAEARRFKKWVTAEVLPAIRQHGRYHDTTGRMHTLLGETIGTDGFHMLASLIRGKVANLPASVQRRATAKLWSQTHTAFGVRSAADIPASQLDAARQFVAAYAVDGEYLPRQPLDQHQRTNLHALLTHVEHTASLWQHYQIHQALTALQSPAGGDLVEHIRSAGRLATQLRDELLTH